MRGYVRLTAAVVVPVRCTACTRRNTDQVLTTTVFRARNELFSLDVFSLCGRPAFCIILIAPRGKRNPFLSHEVSFVQDLPDH